MSDHEEVGERFMRFHALYRDVLKDEFEALEFAEDDFYAFQVLDRAFRSNNQELRNLAAHLQTQREASLETITMRATEILENTRRMKTLELKVLEQKGESGDIAPQVADDGDDFAGQASAAEKVAPTTTPPSERAPGGADGGRKRKGWFR